MATDLTNRVVPSVWTKIINKVTSNVSPGADTIAFVGPALSGTLDEVQTFGNPSTALQSLGACLMTNQMFAAWSGGAGTTKTVRIGGTRDFDSVVYLDNDTSPDDAVYYNITKYLQYRHTDLYDWYDTVLGEFSPGIYDMLGEMTTPGQLQDAIFCSSSEIFDTFDLQWATDADPKGYIEVLYYSGDMLAEIPGWSPFPTITMNDTNYIHGDNGSASVTGTGATLLRFEWELEDVDDWIQTSLVDSEGVSHSGYFIAIRRGEDYTPDETGGWNISRLAKRIGAEAPYLVLYPLIQDGTSPANVIVEDVTTPGSGYACGDTREKPSILFTGKKASSETDEPVTVYTRLVNNRNIQITISRDDSLGNTTTENYTIVPSIDVDTNKRVYSTEDFIADVNAHSTIVTAEDLSEFSGLESVNTCFGWSAPIQTSEVAAQNSLSTAKANLLTGGNSNLDSVNLKDYSYGLSKLSSETDIYWVLPVIPDESLYFAGTTNIDSDKFNAIMQLFYTHVESISEGLNMKPRVLMSWLSPAIQNAGTIQNSNQNIQTGSVNRLGAVSRVLYSVDKLSWLELEGSGSLVARREYLASHFAGMLAGLEPGVPGTRKPIKGGTPDKVYDAEALDILIRNGVLACTRVEGKGICLAKAVTSEIGTLLSAITARRIADRIAVDTTAILEANFIGQSLESQVIVDIKKAIESYLNTKILPATAGGLISGYENIIVLPDGVNPNKVNVAYDLLIKTDLDYIDQTIYLRNNTITVAL